MEKVFDSLEAEIADLDTPDSAPIDLVEEVSDDEISDDTGDITDEEDTSDTTDIEEEGGEEDSESDIETTDTEEVEVDEVTEEVEETPDESDTVQSLRDQITKLTELLAKGQDAQKDPEESDEDDTEEAGTPYDYVGDLDMDDIAADPQIFNTVMHNLEKRILANATKNTMLNIPNLVVHHIKQQKAVNQAVEQFYSENADLARVKSTVGHVANSVSAEHPDWDVQKVFKESAKRTRELLKLPAISKSSKSLMTDPKKVTTKAPVRKATVKSKISKKQQEIDEL